ncbi:hypothetical protein KVT40_009313 [Elsinoe batatas]|uniref:Peptidase M3A/M3B catalytic domain-containing protein n=1 Tax=Elsinoe batatas TaxID=2601811 RepID=A0A8K0PBT2_9PEZI|nr:hypothetical protein KVT40_009313 [Elsinoe batatas]
MPVEDATFGNVVVKLADLDNQIQLNSNLIGLLSKVATDASLRKACHKAIYEQAVTKNAGYDRKDLAQLVDAVNARWQSGDEAQLDEEDTKFMNDTRRAFQQNGILMDDADAAKLADLQQNIRQLEREFASNLDTDDHALALDTEELEGVPEIPGELAELRRLRSNIIGNSASDMAIWDLPYYTRLYREERTQLNEAEVSEYFPLAKTLANMLKLFGRLFGLIFWEIDATVAARLVWHEDVAAYSMWNSAEEGGDFVGYLYLDLYSRSGRSGMPHCHPLQAGYIKPDGSRHYPSTVLITRFEPPAADGHCLLQHSEVVLAFHELGHGIHDLVGKCKYSRYHGAETAADFNEAPSQMLEEWCWNAVGLQQLSSHYTTGGTMPDSVIEALVQSRHAAPMVGLLPQLRITLFDDAVHSSIEDAPLEIGNIYRSCLHIEGIEDVDEEFGYGTYRHLMNGNDGCMYS